MTPDSLQIAKSLIQIVIGITNCNKFVINSDSYYKLRWLIKLETEQTSGTQLNT